MTTEKLGLTPKEFAQASGIPESRVRRMVASGAIVADGVGRRTHALIPHSELQRLRGEVLPMVDLAPALPQFEAMVRRVVREELARIFRIARE